MNIRKALQPACYMCNRVVGPRFIIWSLMDGSDRVFVAHENCAKLIDGTYFGMLVEGKNGKN